MFSILHINTLHEVGRTIPFLFDLFNCKMSFKMMKAASSRVLHQNKHIRSAIFLLAEFGAWWISLNHLNWNIFNNFICCDLKERFQEGNRNCIVVDSLFILRCVRLKFHLNSFSFGMCLYYKIHFVFVNFLRFNIKRREYHMAIN